MKISLENRIIIITQIEDLKNYQISQLHYFGFAENHKALTKFSEFPQVDIFQLIEYFADEGIIYTCQSELESFINQLKLKDKALQEVFNLGRQIKDGNIDIDSFSEFKRFTKTLPRRLKSHQIKSAFHFYTLGNGANFSVPGSGKTSTILCVYEKLRQENNCNVLFVIGPPACFQPWKHEFEETLGRAADSIILSGGNKDLRKSEYYKSKGFTYELYLTTFQTVLNDWNDIIKFLSQKGIEAFLIIDEAHYIKQLGGSWSSSILNISKYAKYKGILTGTPIPKSYKDVFNLFDFLWNENSPLTQEDKFKIEIEEKQKNISSIKLLLNNKIGPLFYRVRKKDLGLKPPNFHEPIIVKMNSAERSIYDYIKATIYSLEMNNYFKNEDVLGTLWKGRMMRLRQAASNPNLLVTAIDNYDENILSDSDLYSLIKNYDKIEIPAKLAKLTEIVRELRKNNLKILIWSNFIGTLEMLKSHFLSMGEGCDLIYGKTPIRKDDSELLNDERTREDIRDEFVNKNSGLNILIANPAACAESISLHKTCFHAIYYDLSYNCAQYIQSLDRIHRVGGSEINEANYYFLQYEASIDIDIKKSLEAKAQKMYDIIETDYEIYNLDLYEDSDDDISAYKRIFRQE